LVINIQSTVNMFIPLTVTCSSTTYRMRYFLCNNG